MKTKPTVHIHRIAAFTVLAFASLAPGLLAQTGCTPAAPDLAVWYPGDGNSHDIEGGNDGMLQNGATFAPGLIGQAFSFDGMDDQVVVPHAANQNGGTQITIDAWIQTEGSGHGWSIMQKRSPANFGGYTFETTHSPYGGDNGLQWVIWIGGSIHILQTPANVLEVGSFQHVAATYDGAMMRIYVDGLEKASMPMSGTIDPTTDDVVIGRNVAVPAFAFHGLIDELDLFQRALSPEEIQAIYNAGVAGKCRVCTPPPADMTAWYPGDSSASDIQGGNDSTLQNGAGFAPGKVGSSFHLDGVDDFVSAASDAGNNFGAGEFSVDTWVRFDSTAGEQVIVEKYIETLDSNSVGFSLTKLVNNQLRLVFTGGSFVESPVEPLVAGTFYHLAATRGASGAVSVFLDGNLIASGTNNADVSSAATLKLGHRGNPTDTPGSNDTRGFYLQGDLDEVALFSRALSAAEVRAIVDAGGAGKCKPSLVLNSVVSRKTQGAGEFDLALVPGPAGNGTVEPRAGGPTTLVFTFSDNVVAADGMISANEFTVTNAAFSTAAISGNTLTLQLSGVVDQSVVSVALHGLNDSHGAPLTGDNDVEIRALAGDANQSRVVDRSDFQLLRTQKGHPLDQTNFLLDLNLDGVIGKADAQAIRQNKLHSVP